MRVSVTASGSTSSIDARSVPRCVRSRAANREGSCVHPTGSASSNAGSFSNERQTSARTSRHDVTCTPTVRWPDSTVPVVAACGVPVGM